MYKAWVFFLLSSALVLVLTPSLPRAQAASDIQNIHRFRSGPERASLVELYTSEGCSSCPAADRWLSSFKDDAGLWTHYVPVAFHVDYWNDLGWPDTFSKPEYSERQRDYVRTWKGGRTYTPAMILNGEEWTDWFRGEAPPDVPKGDKPGVLRLERRTTHEWRIAFRPTGKDPEDKTFWVVNAALLGFDASTDVRRGENAGKKLRHDFIVLDYKTKPLLPSGNEFFAIVRLERPPTWRVHRFGAAAWVTRAGQMKPVQAAGGYFAEQE